MNIFLKILKKTIKALVILVALLFVLATIYLGIDFILKNFISFTARAVLSNFIVFTLVIVFVLRQIVHPQALLEKEQTVIETQIQDSEKAKEESEAKLNSIEKSIEHIEEEINAILQKSDENAKLVGEKILQDGTNTVLTIQENTSKAIENSITILKNELLKRASLASVEVAKNHIINELSLNQNLHDKLIDESIEALKEINQ